MYEDIYFQTKRLIIRHWSDDDIEDLVYGMNNETIARGFKTSYPYTRKDAEKYLLKVKNKKNMKSEYFAITQKENYSLIGGGGIYYKERKFAVGFWLREDKQRKGYGREVLSGIIRYAFETMELDEIYAYFYKSNIGSQKICKYCNFDFKEKNETKICVALTKDKYHELMNNDHLRK